MAKKNSGKLPFKTNQIKYEGKVYDVDQQGNVKGLPDHTFAIFEGQGVVCNCNRPEGSATLVKAIKAEFVIDGTKKKYQGWTFLNHWNGWSAPYFSLAVGKRMAKNMGGKYLPRAERFEFPNDGGIVTCETIETVDGPEQVFPIGNSGWVWQMAE